MIAHDPRPASDGELCTRFARSGDPAVRDAAFAELVRRHGGMVLAACRRIVGAADADDCAQAVFLTLAQKADALGSHPQVGGWLHRVACHVARRSREAASARRRHERGAPPPAPAAGEAQRDLRELIDLALDRLGERYRVPLVLHYLEGRPQDEIAGLLRVPAGTLGSLLSRGRARLRDELARLAPCDDRAVLGLLLAAAPLGALAAGAALARTADLLAAGQTVPAHLAALTHGALHAMSLARLKLAASLVAAVLAGGGAIGGLAAVAAEGTPPAPAPASAPAADPAAAFVSAWIDGLRRNDLAGAFRQLPPTRQAELTAGWHEGLARPDRFRDMLIDRQVGALTDGNAARESARFLAGALGQFGRTALGERPTAPAPGADGQRDRAAGFQGMLTANALSGLVQAVLADGLETRQVDCLEGLFADSATWAAGARLDDPARHEAAATHLLAFGSALGVTTAADLGALDLPQLLTRAGSGLPALKQALAALGLDLDAALASATATGEASAGESRVVVLAFTAFGKPRELPLKLAPAGGGWSVLADSPLARWLRPPMPRWNGGRPGRQGAPSQGDQAAPAPTAPAPAGTSF